MQKIKTAEEVIRSLHEREPDSKAADYVTELESNGYTLSPLPGKKKDKKVRHTKPGRDGIAGSHGHHESD